MQLYLLLIANKKPQSEQRPAPSAHTSGFLLVVLLVSDRKLADFTLIGRTEIDVVGIYIDFFIGFFEEGFVGCIWGQES